MPVINLISKKLVLKYVAIIQLSGIERRSERRKSEHRRVRTSKRILERSEHRKSLRRKHDRKSLRRKSK
jgi:hypothetical protein